MCEHIFISVMTRTDWPASLVPSAAPRWAAGRRSPKEVDAFSTSPSRSHRARLRASELSAAAPQRRSFLQLYHKLCTETRQLSTHLGEAVAYNS